MVAPLRLRKIKENSPTPWYSEHTRALKRAAQKMERRWKKTKVQVQVELYCHSATCGDMQWNEMSCLTGPWCYINTDIQQ